jgi:hypothetical protein
MQPLRSVLLAGLMQCSALHRLTFRVILACVCAACSYLFVEDVAEAFDTVLHKVRTSGSLGSRAWHFRPTQHNFGMGQKDQPSANATCQYNVWLSFITCAKQSPVHAGVFCCCAG